MSYVPRNGTEDDGIQEVELISYEARMEVLSISRDVVIPVISISGIVCNLLSIVVILIHGFGTSSNVFLFQLAVTDILTLVASWRPHLLDRMNVQNSESSARVWFAFDQIFRTFGMAAQYTSLSLPSMITIERLIAVFLPLRFALIVTPFMTWLAFGILYALWFAKFLHSSVFVVYLDFEYDPATNMSDVVVKFTEDFIENYDFHSKINYVVIILGSTVPSVVTAVGCFVISVKLRINIQKRKKMTSSSKAKSTSQTTKTLLAVCFVYLVMCTYKWILNIPQVEEIVFREDGLRYSNAGWVIYEVLSIVSYLNNSLNFVIYVGLNNKFRNTFKNLFTRLESSLDSSAKKELPKSRESARYIVKSDQR